MLVPRPQNRRRRSARLSHKANIKASLRLASVSELVSELEARRCRARPVEPVESEWEALPWLREATLSPRAVLGAYRLLTRLEGKEGPQTSTCQLVEETSPVEFGLDKSGDQTPS